MSTARFIHVEYPKEHPGVIRAERVAGALKGMRQGFDSTRGLALLLLAALVAALVVVADQMIETWADGHLFAAWTALWIFTFAAIALLAGTSRRVASRMMAGLDAWSARVAQRRADARLWEIARSDARVMADLQVALAREDDASAVPAKPGPVQGASDGQPNLADSLHRNHYF